MTRKVHNEELKDIYKVHNAQLNGILRAMNFTKEDREDLIHDLIIKIARLDRIPEGPALQGFLIVSLRRLAIDRIRMSDRARKKVHAFGHWIPPKPSEMEREALMRELMEEGIREISQLPGGEDFRAFYLEGSGIGEIAKASGKPRGTVASSIFRHRKKYQAALQERIDADLPIYHQCLE